MCKFMILQSSWINFASYLNVTVLEEHHLGSTVWQINFENFSEWFLSTSIEMELMIIKAGT